MLSNRYMCYPLMWLLTSYPHHPCRDEDGMVHIFDATGGVG
jgi:hypothetical protein